jgi:phosphatidylserine decarboxylase
MAKSLNEWIETDVQALRDLPMSDLSQLHFFRDPCRPVCSDTAFFFAPADGIILYQKEADPAEPIVDIKGRPYSLQEALRDTSFERRSLVIGIFMTFYDVHVNRIPYPGRLSYRLVDPIDTYNRPMLEIERCLVEDLKVSLEEADYLHTNERMVNRVDAPDLGQSYYILQVADYDVDSITPFELKQNQPHDQGHRFSQIRYGSQVDLIVPLSPRFDFLTTQPIGWHVEAGLDPVIAIKEKKT